MCIHRSESMIFRVARFISRSVHGIFRRRMELKSAAFGTLGGFLWWFGGVSLFKTILTLFGIYLATGGWKFMRIVYLTLPRDMRGLMFLLKAKRQMKGLQVSNRNIVDLFHDSVKRHPQKTAFIMVDGNSWTFQEVDEYSNQVANFFHQQGYRKSDVICVFMENRPEMVFLWLGMAKIGVIPALINFNLRMESLAHCMKISNAKSVICGTEVLEALRDAKSLLPSDQIVYSFSGSGSHQSDGLQAVHLDPLIHKSTNMPPPKDHVTKFNETLFYIYTSGTTGLPKAAIVIHSRYFYMTLSTHHFFKMNSNDVIYDTLPLYHTAGGVLGTGQALIKGCTVVIRQKFSASRFFSDCIKYNCTVVQYIGEICRYLLAQPNKPTDTQHRVRIAFGNGLRPQIWTQFTNRFAIERIGEFYGATEGNANIINPDNKVGAVGFTTRIAPKFYPVTLIRVDEETGEPKRDRHGMCIICEPGQPGELVGKIVQGDPLREFDGYVNKEATKKKICRDVFTKGDYAFLTGDILEMDELGYMYFRDRTGDTFRWRGENVSTSEVEATISNVVKLNDAVVYGVEIPGVEGRAGMAAIVDEQSKIDLSTFYSELQRALPAYARPIFIRIITKVDMTGTFKLQKTKYRKEGYNPGKVTDMMYYMDAKAAQYRPIDKSVHDDICSGRIRF